MTRSRTGSPKSSGTPGGQRTYSDLAIETSLTLRTVFRLPLRQTEGFVASLLRMLRLDLSAPDHSTLSRRAKTLKVTHRPTPARGPIQLIVDRTGLKISGHGPWAAAKHGIKGTREWKKLHIGVDERGFIIAHNVTESGADDASVVPDLLGQIIREIDRFTADGAYDKTAVYDAATARGASVVVPFLKNARTSKNDTAGARGRNATVNAVRELGRREWKKQAGYHQQARVENAFFRYKQLIGGRLRSRDTAAQSTEVDVAVNVLNRMLELGAPRSEPIHN